MSQALNIPDTHKVIERLKIEAGFSEAAARVIVETIQGAKLKDEPATKLDLAELETRITTRFAMAFIGQYVAIIGTLTALYAMFG